MKNSLVVFVGAIMVVVLLAYMLLFQVRYDQTAVVTTFGKATPDSVKSEPGLYPQWPAPIQSVQRYSTLLQTLDVSEQWPLKDKTNVAVRAYLNWRITDPLAFYTTLQTESKAEDQLRTMLRSVLSTALGRRDFDQLVNIDAQKVELKGIEAEACQALNERLSQQSPRWGLAVEQVGITRLLTPKENTDDVFKAMKESRTLLATRIQTDGETQARTIEDQAESQRQIILSFAQRCASDIVAQGVAEAARYIDVFKADPGLAETLRQIEALKKAFEHKTTIILRANQIGAQEITGGTGGKPATKP
jgi:membrane protease subunit HflC